MPDDENESPPSGPSQPEQERPPFDGGFKRGGRIPEGAPPPPPRMKEEPPPPPPPPPSSED